MSVWFWLGLGLVAVLVLVPTALVLWTVFGIAAAGVSHARAQRHARTVAVPGIGEMRTTDGQRWYVDIGDVEVCVVSEGPPVGIDPAMRERLDAIEALGREAAAYVEREHANETDGALEVTGLTWRSANDFDVWVGGDEWSHAVTFRDGRPREIASAH